MSKRDHFQPVQFALLACRATGEVFSGTVSQYDQAGSRRLAESILQVVPEAASIRIHPWMGTAYAASCVEVVRRPASPEPEVSSPVEGSAVADASVEQEAAGEAPQVFSEVDMVSSVAPESVMEPAEMPTEPGVEPVPIRRRGWPPKAKQEA